MSNQESENPVTQVTIGCPRCAGTLIVQMEDGLIGVKPCTGKNDKACGESITFSEINAEFILKYQQKQYLVLELINSFIDGSILKKCDCGCGVSSLICSSKLSEEIMTDAKTALLNANKLLCSMMKNGTTMHAVLSGLVFLAIVDALLSIEEGKDALFANFDLRDKFIAPNACLELEWIVDFVAATLESPNFTIFQSFRIKCTNILKELNLSKEEQTEAIAALKMIDCGE